MSYYNKALSLGADSWFLLGNSVNGSVVADLSPGNHDATMYGATLSNNGPGDGLTHAFNADGVDDYVEIPHHVDFNLLGEPAVTLFYFIRLPNAGDLQHLSPVWPVHFSKGTGNFTYRVNMDGTAWATQSQFWFGGGLAIPNSFVFNSWLFYVMQSWYDGATRYSQYLWRTTSDETMQPLYAPHDYQPTGLANNSSPFRLFARGDTTVERFCPGRIAGMGGVKSRLTIAELDELYDSAFVAGDTREGTFNLVERTHISFSGNVPNVGDANGQFDLVDSTNVQWSSNLHDPDSLSAIQIGSDVYLSWSPSVNPSIDYYGLFRRDGADQTPFDTLVNSPLVTVGSLYHLDNTVIPSTYTYQVFPSDEETPISNALQLEDTGHLLLENGSPILLEG
jgi:hypothetical protein